LCIIAQKLDAARDIEYYKQDSPGDGAMTTISITDPAITESSKIWYSDGTGWIKAKCSYISPNTITAEIPVSDFKGTPIALQSPGRSLPPVP
jgi:hypothetical protein